MLTERRFFRGWIAALRHQGWEVIDARKDVHHRRFARVVADLRAAIASGDATARDVLVDLVPSPFTERFRELDNALVEHQRGEVSAAVLNPDFVGVLLRLSEDQAVEILDSYTPVERALFERLARRFMEDLDERIGCGREADEGGTFSRSA